MTPAIRQTVGEARETRERRIHYRLTYTVLADSRIEAIAKAGALLRTGVTVEALVEAEQGVPGWWDVKLDVEETLGGDPPEPQWLHEDPDFIDHGPDATYRTEGVS